MRLVALLLLILFVCSNVTLGLGLNETSLNSMKDSLEAAKLSALFPGWGQKYAGDEGKGNRILSGGIVNLGFIYYSLDQRSKAKDDLARYQYQYLYDFFATSFVTGYIANIADAYFTAAEIGAGQYYVRKNPWEAAIRSAVLPGYGLIYAGDYVNGIETILMVSYLAFKYSNENYVVNTTSGPKNVSKDLTMYLGGAYYLIGIVRSYFAADSFNNEVKLKNLEEKVKISTAVDPHNLEMRLIFSYKL